MTWVVLLLSFIEKWNPKRSGPRSIALRGPSELAQHSLDPCRGENYSLCNLRDSPQNFRKNCADKMQKSWLAKSPSSRRARSDLIDSARPGARSGANVKGWRSTFGSLIEMFHLKKSYHQGPQYIRHMRENIYSVNTQNKKCGNGSRCFATSPSIVS